MLDGLVASFDLGWPADQVESAIKRAIFGWVLPIKKLEPHALVQNSIMPSIGYLDGPTLIPLKQV